MHEPGHRPSPEDGQDLSFREWFRSWRYLFWLLAVAGAIALFYLVEDWRGEAAWEKYRSEMAQRGEPTALSAIIPPEVSDAANFAMTPSLARLYSTTGSVPVDPRLAKFDAAEAEVKLPKTSRSSSWTRDRTDLLAWSKAFQDAADAKVHKELRQGHGLVPASPPAPGGGTAATGQQSDTPPKGVVPEAATPREAAARVLAELAEAGPLFAELQAASRRPRSRFPLDYANPLPWSILLPHLGPLKHFCQALRLRASAELALGQTDEALDDLLLMLYLADATRDEPLGISLLVRAAQLELALQPLAEGLAAHQWSDAQLRSLQDRLARTDFCADLRRTLLADRLFDCETIEYCQRSRDVHELLPQPSLAARTLLLIAPSGWFCLEERNLSRAFQESLLPAIDPAGRQIHPTGMLEENEARPWLADNALWPSQAALLARHRLFSAVLVPGVAGVARRAAYAQTAADLAALACALERCRLAHRQLPETLDALAPAFIGRVPHDVINGGPLKYRPTKDGGFLLYSVGWNQTDDGGTVALANQGQVDLKTGDWVWGAP